jgi:hypothetical protein
MENQIKIKLTPTQLAHLNADLEMYYQDYGTAKILELWPNLPRKYIVSRANSLGLKVSKAVLSRSNTRTGKYVTVAQATPVDKSKHAELMKLSVSKPWSSNNGRT